MSKRLSLALIGLLAFVVVAPLHAALSDNLVSCWTMDNAGWTDSYGGNTLTDHNTVGNVAGKISNAGDFELASMQYLSHVSNASLQMGDIDFTIVAWIKPETVDGITPFEIVTKDDDAANSRDYTLAQSGLGHIRFYVNGGGTPEVTSTATVSAGTFYFVAAYHDSVANTVNVSVNDGAVDSAATGGAVPNTSAAEFRIGAREYASFEEYYDGLIDEVAIWKRKLSAAEITDLYNAGGGSPAGRACSYIVPVAPSRPCCLGVF